MSNYLTKGIYLLYITHPGHKYFFELGITLALPHKKTALIAQGGF